MHRQLLKQVWGTSYEREMHLVRVNISNRHRKIEPDPSRLYYLRREYELRRLIALIFLLHRDSPKSLCVTNKSDRFRL